MRAHARAAMLPATVQGLIAAILVATGAFPAGAAAAAAAALPPLGTYFDLKQIVAYASGWPWFAVAVAASVVTRGSAFAVTLWLTQDDRRRAFTDGLHIALLSVVAAFPAAGLFFSAVAVRYAPFAWAALLLMGVATFVVARRALRRLGAAAPLRPSTWLLYLWGVVALGALLSWAPNRPTAAVIVAASGPLHGLVWLHVPQGVHRAARIVAALTLVAGTLLLGAGVVDRYVHEPVRARAEPRPGPLLLMGGVDSTSRSGALHDFDPRWLGFDGAHLLSYAGPGRDYDRADTHEDLHVVADRVTEQLGRAEPPRSWLGHSQSGLILDRIDRSLPAAAVDLAAPPLRPPPIEVPRAGSSAPGSVGSDFARLLAALFDAVGLVPFDIDAPASPAQLEPVTPRRDSRRLVVWALGDSVWLYGDWRRPSATNVVALTDHVGVTRNARALETARRFYAGEDVTDDSGSWRSVLVETVQAVFAPWRPDRA